MLRGESTGTRAAAAACARALRLEVGQSRALGVARRGCAPRTMASSSEADLLLGSYLAAISSSSAAFSSSAA